MTRIAINDLGHIGKLRLRKLIDTGAVREIVLLNDPVGDADQHAVLMELDSVHGRWRRPVAAADGALVLNGRTIRLTHEKTIEALPLAALGVDVVIDCTGVFKTAAKVAPHYSAGVKRVVVSASVKDGGALNLVYGVKHHLYDGSQSLITAASCATNCLAPVVKVIHKNIGSRDGFITTIHDVTNTQTIVVRPAKDIRRFRSVLMNLIPTTTGSATAITLIYPELKGRLNGHAVRVPLLNPSLTNCGFDVQKTTSVDEVNALFKSAADGPLKGILEYEARALVSCDLITGPRSLMAPEPWSQAARR